MYGYLGDLQQENAEEEVDYSVGDLVGRTANREAQLPP